MKTKLRVRPAFYDDEDAVVAIMNQAIIEKTNAFINPFEWAEGTKWYKELRENSNLIVVCETKDGVIGWGSLSNYRGGRAAFLSTKEITFYVHEDYRRLGAASSMIDHLESQSKEMKVEHLVALLLDDNNGSRALLEKHGYFVWGMIEGIAKFSDRNRGHLYMGKHL